MPGNPHGHWVSSNPISEIVRGALCIDIPARQGSLAQRSRSCGTRGKRSAHAGIDL